MTNDMARDMYELRVERDKLRAENEKLISDNRKLRKQTRDLWVMVGKIEAAAQAHAKEISQLADATLQAHDTPSEGDLR